MNSLKLKPGPGFLVEATWEDGKAWARFELDEQGRLRNLAELRIPNPTAEALRRVPLARIEVAVRAHTLLQIALAAREDEPVPADLRDAEFYGPGVSEPRRYKLRRPAARKLDDTFFENVARAYRDAAIRGLNPRQTLAADAGVSPDTVAGWVMEARRPERGYLPPAHPGKVTV